MSYAGTKLGNILKSIVATKELSKLRDRENTLEHAFSLLNETTIKMDDYLTSEYGNLKSIIVDFVLNEIKTFSIINTKHSKRISSLKEATELNENYNYLIEYIKDYNIYTGEFFKEALGIEHHMVLAQAICRKLSESLSIQEFNEYPYLDLGQKESLKISIFDKTFAELEERDKTTYKQEENESFEKIKEKFNIGKIENKEMPNSGVYIVEKNTNNEIKKESKCQ